MVYKWNTVASRAPQSKDPVNIDCCLTRKKKCHQSSSRPFRNLRVAEFVIYLCRHNRKIHKDRSARLFRCAKDAVCIFIQRSIVRDILSHRKSASVAFGVAHDASRGVTERAEVLFLPKKKPKKVYCYLRRNDSVFVIWGVSFDGE